MIASFNTPTGSISMFLSFFRIANIIVLLSAVLTQQDGRTWDFDSWFNRVWVTILGTLSIPNVHLSQQPAVL